MSQQQINFSFIIPHKNTPSLLTRCISSIPVRSDVQIIVVDDNSDGSIVDFNNFPSCNHPLVEIIYLGKSRGAGAARNIGIEKAKGKWILFADSDDFYNYCLEDRLLTYCNSDYDIIYFKANSIDTKYYTNSNRGVYLNKYIDLYTKNNKKSLDLLRYKFGEPWSKMIKRELILKYNIQFDEISVHNDTTFSLLVGHYSEKVAVDNYAIYCVTLRSGSISHVFTDEKKLVRIDVFSKVDCFYTDQNVKLPKIKRHFIALIDFFFHNRIKYKEGFNIMLENGLSKGYIYKNMLINIPLYFAFCNRFLVYKLLNKIIQ